MFSCCGSRKSIQDTMDTPSNTGNMTGPSPAQDVPKQFPALANGFIKSPGKPFRECIFRLFTTEFLSIPEIMDNARAADNDLQFQSLLPDQLEVIARRVEVAIKDRAQNSQYNKADIPWIGLPKTFWYWTANMSHYNKSLMIMPCALSEPTTVDGLRAAVDIARSAKVQVSWNLPFEMKSHVRCNRERVVTATVITVRPSNM